MEFILKEIETALDNGLYFMALQSALTLPDICGALQSSDGKATGAKYIDWYNNYAKEPSCNALTGEDCYRFRCSYLHQGNTQHPNSTYCRILFIVPGSPICGHNNIFNDALNIDILIFCNNIINAVRKWRNQISQDPHFIANYDKLIKIYPHGLSPYIIGIPVIS